jgi:hypothetical protein
MFAPPARCLIAASHNLAVPLGCDDSAWDGGPFILANKVGVAGLGGPKMLEEHPGSVRLRPAWRGNLLWLSLIAMIASATIFLLH